PIPDAENRRPEEDASPWKTGIGCRLDHVEVAFWHHRAQVFKSADAIQSYEREAHRADDENHRLHGVGVEDRGESAGDRINAGNDDEHDGSLYERPSRDALQDNARCV